MRRDTPPMPASILIVDDEPRLGDALQRALELEGHDAAYYLSDPEAALRALRARAFRRRCSPIS